MFGSSKKLKIAEEIANAVENTIRLSYAKAGDQDITNNFKLPLDLWLDDYVLGYAFGLTNCFIMFDYPHLTMATSRKLNFMMLVFAIISKNEQSFKIVQKNLISKSNANFKQGSEDGVTTYGAMSGKLKSDDTSHVLTEAKKLAKRQHEFDLIIAENMSRQKPSMDSSIGMAVEELTLGKYIAEKYFSSEKQLMTPAEIHDFGVEIVFGLLKKEGYEIVDVNTDISKNPQIIANKDGNLCFIVVRTDCYPEKGKISTESEFFKILEHAKIHKATPYFAPVGICYADAKDSKEAGAPYKGKGFNALFDGLLIMSTLDRIQVLK